MKQNIKLIGILFLIILVVILVIVGVKIKKEKEIVPTISLIGTEIIELNLNDTYDEQGAKAFIKEIDSSDLVEIKGEVDTSKPGEYTLKYIITNQKNNKINAIERKVIVKDNIAPIIELKDGEEVTVYKDSKYEEAGYTASDNCDGNITDNVIVTGDVDTSKVGTYEITYSVEDSYQNKTEVKRKIIVKEKNISTNNVNTSGKGLPVLMYHFFYDKSKGETGEDGNWMEISAFEAQMKYLSDNNFNFPTWNEVKQYVEGKISLPDKSVVITIDDGDQSFIDLAIPIIEKYNVKATSFVVASWNGDWVPQTYASNHMYFESHSYNSHMAGENGKGKLVNMSYDQAVEDVTKSKNIIGKNVTVFCYPFGHYNDTVIQALRDNGYNMAFTTVEGRVYPGMNKFTLPRVRMMRGVSLETFKSKVN